MNPIQHSIQKEHEQALHHVLLKLSIPDGYEFKAVRSATQDGTDVWVFRYEKANGENTGLGGEHYSFTVTQDTHTVLGMMWLNQHFEKGQQLPSDDETREIVRCFLDKVEPGLFERAENRWIRPEDFPLTVDGARITVTGMRYKLYVPPENKWAWVIVAPDRSVMAFEQDMLWLGGRISEMWLHDTWIRKGAADGKLTSYVKNLIRKL